MLQNPFAKFAVLILLLVFVIGGGFKALTGRKVDFNDPNSVAKYGDKFATKCVDGLEGKYAKIGVVPTASQKSNFQKACDCMWAGVVVAAKKRNKKMSISELQDVLKGDASYDAAVGRCAELYPVLPR